MLARQKVVVAFCKFWVRLRFAFVVLVVVVIEVVAGRRKMLMNVLVVFPCIIFGKFATNKVLLDLLELKVLEKLWS